jgi:allophanate hydrolase subunit 2
VVPGLYIHRLTEDAVERFFADTWTVGSEADRIGYRFKGGQAMQFKPREQPFGAGSDPSNIVDACYPIGSIQIPGAWNPSSCCGMRSPVAATPPSARSSAPTST